MPHAIRGKSVPYSEVALADRAHYEDMQEFCERVNEVHLSCRF